MDLRYSIPYILFLSVFLSFSETSYAGEKKAGSSAALLTPVAPVSYDKRVQILRDFLKSHDSPLADNAETFIKTADDNKLDWKLVAAISGVESSFARQLPYDSYNAWGWGIYGDNMITFPSYDEAIETISTSLRKDYIDSWKARDVYQIGKIYAASPTWAQKVEYFMNKIERFGEKDPTLKLTLSL